MFFVWNQLLSFSAKTQGTTTEWHSSPRSRRSISVADNSPMFCVPWEREVIRTGASSLYWLLSKLTTAISSGCRTPRFYSWETTRNAISSL